MSFEDEIAELKRMRFFESGEVDLFEKILNELAIKADETIIHELCSIFDDRIPFPSAGEHLLETIFVIIDNSNIETGMIKLIEGTKIMVPHAKKWAIIMHRSILDSNDLLNAYKDALKRVDQETKKLIVSILKEIKEKRPKVYAEKVENALLACY